MFLITDPDLTFLFTVFWGLVILGIFRFFLPVHPFWRHHSFLYIPSGGRIIEPKTATSVAVFLCPFLGE